MEEDKKKNVRATEREIQQQARSISLSLYLKAPGKYQDANND